MSVIERLRFTDSIIKSTRELLISTITILERTRNIHDGNKVLVYSLTSPLA